MDGFLNQTKEDDETAQFASYFESLHKVFKYCHLQGRKNKRLDKSMDALLKLARDQIFKRVRKVSKNTCHKQEDAIWQSHQKAVTGLKTAKIQQVSSSVWTLSSFSNTNVVYEVTKITENLKICSNVVMHTLRLVTHGPFAYTLTLVIV